MHSHHQHPQSFASFGPPGHAPSPVYAQGVPAYAYSSSSAGVSPPHSAFQELYGFTPLVSPQPGHAYVVSPGVTYAAPIPQVAIASPTTPATSPYSYVYPSTALHQRVFDLTGQNRHTLRRSVG
ncbi:hypothetical protein BKA70DRAFT_1252382 [Coprinopsis sp. MPI-PUGE-AT-0042]|nr:hypothetical protein BKA70DRAFT_1252382 [Coprinopsis sp. MPI-PUGE-AT-0042]